MDDQIVYSAVNLLIQTSRMHRNLVETNVKHEIGIHRTQHMILMHLAAHDSLMSQKALARHLNISAAAVTGALKKLELDGYISRCAGGDNRYNEITITELGRQVVVNSRRLFQIIDKSLFEGFCDEEISFFVSYLERIKNNINKGENGHEKMV